MLNLIAYNLIRISQIADGLADSAHNRPVAPRVRRQKDIKGAISTFFSELLGDT